MIDLLNELNELSKNLSKSGEQMKRYGKELAEAERDYKITLRQEALKFELMNRCRLP